jgi:hypothetical protein
MEMIQFRTKFGPGFVPSTYCFRQGPFLIVQYISPQKNFQYPTDVGIICGVARRDSRRCFEPLLLVLLPAGAFFSQPIPTKAKSALSKTTGAYTE